MESGHSLDPTVVCHGEFIFDVLLAETSLISPSSTSSIVSRPPNLNP